MRTSALLVLCYVGADILTTTVGLRMGMTETNFLVPILGWNWIMAIKIIGALLVAFILQIKKPGKLDKYPALVLVPFVVFNAFQIVLAW